MKSEIQESRAAELKLLEQIIPSSGPDVIGLYGIAGVGKSSLLNEFARLHSRQCIKIDCRDIEPTARSFLQKLKVLTESESLNYNDITDKLPENCVLILDQFESFNLLESWLRREFVPAMKGRLKLIFCGRQHPDNQWVLNPPANARYRCIKLAGLSYSDAVNYLESQGHAKVLASGINQFANGHPLALKLASSAILEQPERQLNEIPPNDVIQTLVQYFVDDIKEVPLRKALEAASVVRRISVSLLAEMLGLNTEESSRLYESLSQVEFTEQREDGLNLHEVLRNVLSSHMKARAPRLYSEYRSRAYHCLHMEMRSASSSQLWRYTADILYLVDNPVIRSAFFPQSDVRDYSVEIASEQDKEAVLEIVAAHEPECMKVIYQNWWDRHLSVFHCVKDSLNCVVGFYCLIKPDEASRSLLLQDPVTAMWLDHLNESSFGDRHNNDTIFIRRWLSLKEGESLSGVQAACWLDIKRTYLEMRPELRRVYLTLTDIQPYAAVATELGFQVLDRDLELDGHRYFSAMLDMGNESVDGWISKRLVNEIQQEKDTHTTPEWFDMPARQINLNGARQDLTPLEFGTLELLIQHSGQAVTRKDLLREVWGIEYEGSSNVVDTIVLSLRKKLAEHSCAIQSVRGTGYRYAP